MTDESVNGFITKKHGRLMTIASVANVFAWIALISQVLYAVATFMQFQNTFEFQFARTGLERPNMIEMLSQNPVVVLSYVVDIIRILVRGVIYWLVLKGISLGLFMIVETDLNYKVGYERVVDEQ